jgi:hypothetical protein
VLFEPGKSCSIISLTADAVGSGGVVRASSAVAEGMAATLLGGWADVG